MCTGEIMMLELNGNLSPHKIVPLPPINYKEIDDLDLGGQTWCVDFPTSGWSQFCTLWKRMTLQLYRNKVRDRQKACYGPKNHRFNTLQKPFNAYFVCTRSDRFEHTILSSSHLWFGGGHCFLGQGQRWYTVLQPHEILHGKHSISYIYSIHGPSPRL